MRERHAIAGTIALGLGIDLLSFIGWSAPRSAPFLAFVVLLIVAALTLRDLRWGIAAVLLELLWGSHGYLLRIPAQGLDLSLRMGLTFVVLAVSLWRLREDAARRQLIRALRMHPVRWPALAFLATLLLGLLLGALRHPWDRVFFDANAWGFLVLAPAFMLAASLNQRSSNRHENAQGMQNAECKMQNGETTGSSIILTGALYLVVRTYVLLFLFTHDLGGLWMPLYQWVRDARLGEVTIFPGAFPRVFLPSMVLLFPALLIAAQRVVAPHEEGEREEWGRRALSLVVFGGSVTVLLLSLSRSYWLAGVVLSIIGIAWAAFRVWRGGDLSQFRTKLRKVIGTVSALGIATVVSVGIAIVLVRLPYPRPLTTVGVGETLLARLATDAAVSNRWQQLPPLRDAIRAHPLLGNGFGAAVTYATRDPRTLAAFPNGEYTTTAFEWGYLDDLLERGFVGLLAELWLVGALIWHGLRRGGEIAALALGLLAVAFVHATSPYLNHPLGLGALVFLFTLITPVGASEIRDARGGTSTHPSHAHPLAAPR